MVKGIVLGVLLGIVGVFLGAYLYFSTGQAPVAVGSPEMPFESKFARMAQHAYMAKKPHLNSAVPEDEQNILQGAKVYKENCAVCHGLPGEPKTSIANGMFPKPPQLFRGVGVTDDESWETYWKVADGIRMTGMPGFKDSLGETKMWQVSILLKNADKISPAVKTELTSGNGVPPTMPSAPAATPASTGKTDEQEHDHSH